MLDLMTMAPWAIAAVLYLENGWTWLRLVMVTDISDRSRVLLDDMNGKNGRGAAAAARVAAASVILGWPAYQVFGWINARREIKAEQDHG